MTEKIITLRGNEISTPIYKQKRDCFSELHSFIQQTVPPFGKILAVYGLRRTGKTVMMQQCIHELDPEQKKKSAYLLCQRGCDMYQLRLTMDTLLAEGIRYFFIDEITEAEDFQVYGNVLSDIYSIKGARIVIAGTDSLGIMLAQRDILYDRIEMIHTSHIPYEEFARLKGKGIEEYIEYGGTLTDAPYKSMQAREEYMHSAIVSNILHSLEKSEDVRTHRQCLTELHEKGELTSVLNKMINKFSYHITLKAVNRYFKSAPLYSTIHNIRNEFTAADIHAQTVNQAAKQALSIKDTDETEKSFTQKELTELKSYLKDLDLFLEIPSMDSLKYNDRIEKLEIFLQPGMVYTHASELVKILDLDNSWRETCTQDSRNEFKNRADHFFKGILLENIILSETYLCFQQVAPQRYYVSQLSVSLPESKRQAEVDLLIADLKTDEVHLFEIKFSKEKDENQKRHLNDPDFLAYIEQNFGQIKSKSIIYMGAYDDHAEVKYLNAEKFLCCINEMKIKQEIKIDQLLRTKDEQPMFQNIPDASFHSDENMTSRDILPPPMRSIEEGDFLLH